MHKPLVKLDTTKYQSYRHSVAPAGYLNCKSPKPHRLSRLSRSGRSSKQRTTAFRKVSTYPPPASNLGRPPPTTTNMRTATGLHTNANTFSPSSCELGSLPTTAICTPGYHSWRSPQRICIATFPPSSPSHPSPRPMSRSKWFAVPPRGSPADCRGPHQLTGSESVDMCYWPTRGRHATYPSRTHTTRTYS